MACCLCPISLSLLLFPVYSGGKVNKSPRDLFPSNLSFLKEPGEVGRDVEGEDIFQLNCRETPGPFFNQLNHRFKERAVTAKPDFVVKPDAQGIKNGIFLERIIPAVEIETGKITVRLEHSPQGHGRTPQILEQLIFGKHLVGREGLNERIGRIAASHVGLPINDIVIRS